MSRYEVKSLVIRPFVSDRTRFWLIKSELKWSIHLSRSLFLYFNYLVSVTAGGQ